MLNAKSQVKIRTHSVKFKEDINLLLLKLLLSLRTKVVNSPAGIHAQHRWRQTKYDVNKVVCPSAVGLLAIHRERIKIILT